MNTGPSVSYRQLYVRCNVCEYIYANGRCCLDCIQKYGGGRS